jgi:hypothetical protein
MATRPKKVGKRRKPARRAADKLTVRQLRFIDCYLEEPNASKAALRAGYAAGRVDVTGTEQLQHPADSRVVDPLARLFDPAFTATTWPYEFSQTDPEIPGSLHPKQSRRSRRRKAQMALLGQPGREDDARRCRSRISVARPASHLIQALAAAAHVWASALSWELWEKILLPELLTWIPRDRLIRSSAAARTRPIARSSFAPTTAVSLASPARRRSRAPTSTSRRAFTWSGSTRSIPNRCGTKCSRGSCVTAAERSQR